MATGLPMRVNNIWVHLLDCDKQIQYVTDDVPVFWFPGRESTTASINTTFRSIAAIVSECYNRAAQSIPNGGELVLNFGCGYAYPEFDTLFINGQVPSYDVDGNILTSLAKPGEDGCYQCDKVGSEDCEQTFAILVDYCIEDCNSKVIDRKFMVIRCVNQAVNGSPKQVGGNNNANFSSALTVSVETSDGYGEGPADLVQSYDEDGLPSCESVTCDVPCPEGLDFAALDELCDCAGDLAGAVTADVIAANPELDHPFFTGV